MADVAPGGPVPSGGVRRFLTFRLDRQLYAVPADEVAEVIRLPPIARVPLSPKGLLGMANLRGSVLPVASVRSLLGRREAIAERGERAIVLTGATPVALAVDAVDALVSLDATRVETHQADLAAEPGEMLSGAFQPTPHQDLVKILDIHKLLAAAFVQRSRSKRPAPGRPRPGPAVADVGDGPANSMLVIFEVAGQEYALDLDAVQEILPLPDTIALVPRAEALVLGVTSLRQRLLPLLSLRGLLGLAPSEAADRREKVIVAAVAGILVGLVVDRMRTIIRADHRLIDPTPSLLAARRGGETGVRAIYRGDGGRRLISILAPGQLFRDDVMQRLSEQNRQPGPKHAENERSAGTEAQFLVFRLGDEEFGLPIECVDEVARVPDQITRVPKTPQFLEGVVNLRGEVLPVVDQRRRFELPALETERQRRRLVVVRTARHRAGLIVDSVSEVLRAATQAVEPAPDFANGIARVVNGVINLAASGRMVLLLDPGELFDRTERGALDDLAGATAQAPS